MLRRGALQLNGGRLRSGLAAWLALLTVVCGDPSCSAVPIPRQSAPISEAGLAHWLADRAETPAVLPGGRALLELLSPGRAWWQPTQLAALSPVLTEVYRSPDPEFHYSRSGHLPEHQLLNMSTEAFLERTAGGAGDYYYYYSGPLGLVELGLDRRYRRLLCPGRACEAVDTNLWMGGRAVRTAAHYDAVHNGSHAALVRG